MGIEDEIRRIAATNAVEHGGSASLKAVLSRLLGSHPELRPRVKELIPLVRRIVEEVNALPLEEQEKMAQIREKKEAKRGLEPLPGAEGGVVMRMAPNPSGPLHIGHSRMAVLNDEYVKMYGGRLILRFEDTNPTKVDPEAYDMIAEDLEWLGVEVHEKVYQSDRMELYYRVAEEMIRRGCAYATTRSQEEIRESRRRGIPLPERNAPPEENMETWRRMLEGEFGEGEAVLIVKTDLSHPNPSVRDFVAFRILEREHPRTGTKYRVFPTYNFAVAVDDHYNGVTHVLRGKDHMVNTEKQRYVYRCMGWREPVFIHYGLVRIVGVNLKTSRIREGILRGEYSGWDDVRLGTLRALRSRGIRPEAIREYWLEVGLKDVDINFSWETLYAINRKIVDPVAPRIFFVPHPKEISIRGLGEARVTIPLHPSRDLGSRTITLPAEPRILVPSRDWDGLRIGEVARLKYLANVRKVSDSAAELVSREPGDVSALRGRIWQWAPSGDSIRGRILYPDGSVEGGAFEPYATKLTEKIVQMERVGFGVLYGRGGWLEARFAHR
ncbi:MAG: glutamate--tRNA ligase [Thermoplasmata archaeon]|nr:MAG: glutamate--tRNA ligase [Thermoplasmata archaeon]